MSSLKRFRNAYEGTPPWDIGRPQREIVRLEEKGKIVGDVLDVGCGTGQNALFLAVHHRVTGVDGSPGGITKAKERAKNRGIDAKFRTADALKLQKLNKKFDTIIDSALFHVFTGEEREKYVKSLKSALKKKGTVFILCFNEKGKKEGPRCITKEEIKSVFKEGWKINYIKDAVYETLLQKDGAKAYLASITRVK